MQDEQQIDIFADRKVTRLGNTWYFELQSINLRVKVDNLTSTYNVQANITLSYLNPIFDKEHIHSSQIAINQLGGTNGR